MTEAKSRHSCVDDVKLTGLHSNLTISSRPYFSRLFLNDSRRKISSLRATEYDAAEEPHLRGESAPLLLRDLHVRRVAVRNSHVGVSSDATNMLLACNFSLLVASLGVIGGFIHEGARIHRGLWLHIGPS